MPTAREAINKLKWSRGLNGCTILIRHRGAPSDVKALKGELIKEVGRTFLIYVEGGVEVYIPYHRVLEVINAKGETVFKRR
jgi:uncharacterized protein (UPF0248 family)